MRKLLLICLTLVVSAFHCKLLASDSVHIINSFYRLDNNIQSFRSSTRGDSVSIVYSGHIRTDNNNISLTHLQVRSWNSQTGKSLTTQNFFHKQEADESPTFRIGLLDGSPALVYTPEVKHLSIVNAMNGVSIRDYSFDDTIRNIYMSPDFTHSVICTKDDRFYIMNVVNGNIILKDSVWHSYVYGMPPDIQHGLIDSSFFTAHFKVHCRSDSWSPDNSQVMLRVDRISDTLGTDIQYRFESYWRPYNLTNKKYLADSIYMGKYGVWDPHSKYFTTYNLNRFYYTGTDTIPQSIYSSEPIVGYGLTHDAKLVTLVNNDSMFSVWNLPTKTKISSFVPGIMLSYCFNDDRSLLAYLTSDTVLHVVNIRTLQGIYQIHIPFTVATSFGDMTTMSFLSGDRAMLIRDSSQNFSILDLATRGVVASVDIQTTSEMSEDGTALFLLTDKIRRYDLFTGDHISTFPEGELLSTVKNICLSQNGKQLLACDNMDRVQLWDVEQSKLLFSSGFHAVKSIRYCPDNAFALLEHQDSLNSWWTILHTSDLATNYSFDTQERWLNFSMSGRAMLSAKGSRLYLRHPATGALIRSYDLNGAISAATMSIDDSLIVVADSSGSIEVVNSDTKQLRHLADANKPVNSLILSRSKAFLSFISTTDNTLVRVSDGQRVQNLSYPTLESNFCDSDSTCFCVYENSLILFNTRKGSSLQVLTPARAFLRPQKNYYAIGLPDARDSLTIYDYKTNKAANVLRNVPTHSDIVWSGDAMTLATTDLFNNIVIWTPAHLRDGETVSDVEEAVSSNNQFGLSPQPVRDVFHLRFDSQSDIRSVRMSNVLGQVFTPSTLNAGSYSTSELPSGYYNVRVEWSNGHVATLSTMVQHDQP